MRPLMPPIRIAAALIDDGAGRMLLVRKAGTSAYMQAGGKIEPGEAPINALRRELAEEIGLDIADAPWLGRFEAPAANEPGCTVEAELFHLTMPHQPIVAAEIEEALWVPITEAAALPLAPMTRIHVLPIALNLPR